MLPLPQPVSHLPGGDRSTCSERTLGTRLSRRTRRARREARGPTARRPDHPRQAVGQWTPPSRDGGADCLPHAGRPYSDSRRIREDGIQADTGDRGSRCLTTPVRTTHLMYRVRGPRPFCQQRRHLQAARSLPGDGNSSFRSIDFATRSAAWLSVASSRWT